MNRSVLFPLELRVNGLLAILAGPMLDAPAPEYPAEATMHAYPIATTAQLPSAPRSPSLWVAEYRRAMAASAKADRMKHAVGQAEAVKALYR